MSELQKLKPRSEHLSREFMEDIWPCFEAEFGGKLHTLKNYKNTLDAFCEFTKEDFLDVKAEDVERYYAYLNERVENGLLSSRSMLTYQKTLRAMSCAVERYIDEKKLMVAYQNCFRNSVKGDVRAISADAWLVHSEDVSKLIAYAHTPKEMLVLLMLTEGALTASQITSLTWENFHEEDEWFAYDEEHGFYVTELFLIAWKDYREECRNKGLPTTGQLFTNRNGNPINTKGISTLIKRCRMEAGLEQEITARQLRDFALMQKLTWLLGEGEKADAEAAKLDDGQITRMRELYVRFAEEEGLPVEEKEEEESLPI